MSNESEQPQRRRPPRIVSYGLLTLGGIAVIAPVFLLYRANPNRITFSRRLRTNAPPPVRQSSPVVVENNSIKLSDISFSPRRALTTDDEDEVVPAGQGPGPLQALKALGIATCIVGAVAITSVLGVKTFFGVDSPQQFAQVMKDKLAVLAPLLVSRIHRDPSEADFSHISPLHPQTVATTLGSLGSEDPLQANSLGWLKDIEEQLKREEETEREARLSRKKNEPNSV